MFDEDPLHFLSKLDHCFRPILDTTVVKGIWFDRIAIAALGTFNIKRSIIGTGDFQLPVATAATSVFQVNKHLPVLHNSVFKELHRYSGRCSREQGGKTVPVMPRRRKKKGRRNGPL